MELNKSEIHEIITALVVNRTRIRGRKTRTERALEELKNSRWGYDKGRELYLQSLIGLRQMRMETISELIKRFEEYAKNDSIS
jgi:hypothetical protein